MIFLLAKGKEVGMFWTDYLRSELLKNELKQRQGLCDFSTFGRTQAEYLQLVIDNCPKSLDAEEMTQYLSICTNLQDRRSLQSKVGNQVEAYSSEDNDDVLDSKTTRDSSKGSIDQSSIQKPFSIVKIQGVRYLLKSTLGTGVCGVAKKAINLENGTVVVVKIVRPILPYLSSIALASAYNEEKILAQLRRGGFLWARQLGADWQYRNSGFGNWMRTLLIKEKIYTVQDFIPGKPLDKVLTDYKENANLKDVGLLLAAATKSLQKLHKQFIFHGDIKLENILFDGTQAHFIDFGLSCNTDGYGMIRQDAKLIMHNAPYALLQERQTVGFYHQCSPEWKEGGTLSLKTDVYALGKTFEEILRTLNIDNPGLQNIIGSMVDDNPVHRPSLEKIANEFGFFISRQVQMEEHTKENLIHDKSSPQLSNSFKLY